MGAVDERKALERLTRATRKLVNGDTLGASQPPAAELADAAPATDQAAPAEPRDPNAPPA